MTKLTLDEEANIIAGPCGRPHQWRKESDRDAMKCTDCGAVVTGEQIKTTRAAAEKIHARKAARRRAS